MISNKNFRRFLTTASVLGIITTTTQESFAGALSTTSAPATLSTQAGIRGWVTGDTIKLSNDTHTLALDVAGAVTNIVIAARVNANTATVTQNITIGAVSDDNTLALAAGPMELAFGGAAIVTLNGVGTALGFNPVAPNSATTYNQLGAVDFNNTASTLLVTAHTLNLAGAILSTGSNGVADKGTLTVSGHTNTFSGAIGSAGNEITLNVTNNTANTTNTFSHANAVRTTAVTISGAGNTVFTGAGGVKVTTGNFDASASTGTVGVTNAAGDLIVDAGNIILGSGVTTFGNHVTATLGSINTGNAVTNVGAGGNVTAATTITTGTGRLTIADGTLTAGTGLVVGAGGITTGAGLAKVTAGNANLSAAAAASTFAGGITVTAGNFVTGAGAVTLSGAGALTMTATNSEVIVGTGGLVLAGRNATFTNGGKIQLNGNALTANSTAAALTIGATANVADIVTNTAGTGTVNLIAQANALNIKSNIGSAAKAVSLIAVTGNNVATIGGAGSTTTDIAATNTIIGAGSTLNVDARLNSIAYSGLIDGAAADQGILQVNGVAGTTVTFNNAIGSTRAISAITHGDVGQGNAIYKGTVRTAADLTVASGSDVTFNDIVTIGGLVTVDGASVLTFNKDITVTGGVIILANVNDRINFRGNVAGCVIISDAGDQGILEFGNGTNSNITVDGRAGLGAIGTTDGSDVVSVILNLAGGTLTLGNTYSSGSTIFTTDDRLVLSSDIGSTLGVVTTKISGSAGTVIINEANPITNGNIGAIGGRLKELRLAHANGTLTIDAGNVLHTNVTTATPNTNIVTFGLANISPGLNIGTSTAPLSAVNANGRSITVGTIYAQNIITGTGTIIADGFNGTVATNVAGGTAIVNDKGTIGKVIGSGTLTFNGSATITGPICTTTTPLRELKISTDTVTFNDSVIFATIVNHKAATLKLPNATTINAPTSYNATGSTFDIGINEINIVTPALNISGNISVNMSASDRTAVFTGMTAINVAMAANDKVTLNISDIGSLSSTNKLVTLFKSPAGKALTSNALTSANVKLGTNSNRFVKGLKYLGTNDEVSAAIADGATEATAGMLLVKSEVTVDKLTDAPQTHGVREFVKGIIDQFNDGTLPKDSDAAKYVKALGDLSIEESTKSVAAVADRSVSDIGNNIIDTIVGSSAQVINTRIDIIRGSVMASDHQGVAAGDSADKFGVWTEVIGGAATQKMRKNVSGFQSKMSGMIVGGDTMINDKAMIGGILGHAGTEISHKDGKAGDSTKSNSWICGLYGNYNPIIDKNFFTQGNLTIAQTSIKAKEGRIGAPVVFGGAGAREIAKSNYNILGIAAKILGGYKFIFENLYIAPTMGLRYSYFSGTSYTQTGTENQNLKVATKATNGISALTGVTFGSNIDIDAVTIMPEVHVNLSYALNPSAARTSYAISGMNNVRYKGPRGYNIRTNLGATVTVQSGRFEYGAGCDANISDKYFAYQGSINIKVKF